MVYYFFSHLEMLILVTVGLTKSDGTAKILSDTNIKDYFLKGFLPLGILGRLGKLGRLGRLDNGGNELLISSTTCL